MIDTIGGIVMMVSDQQWGGIMCKVKDEDGNPFALISSPTTPEA